MLKNALLLLIAALLCLALALPNLVIGIVKGIQKKNLKNRLSQSFFGGAFALDMFGNIAYADLLNALFALPGGYQHGRKKESVSSALGKRWTQNKNTLAGECLTGFLNLIDKGDHCYRAIEPEDHWPLPMPQEPIAWWKTGLAIGVVLLLLWGLIEIVF